MELMLLQCCLGDLKTARVQREPFRLLDGNRLLDKLGMTC